MNTICIFIVILNFFLIFGILKRNKLIVIISSITFATIIAILFIFVSILSM